MSAKEPYISAKEPYIYAKEPFTSDTVCKQKLLASDDGMLRTKQVVYTKEPYISAKEPYIPAKEPYKSAKEPYTSDTVCKQIG